MKEAKKLNPSNKGNDARPFRSFGQFAARPENPGDENKRHPLAGQAKTSVDTRRSKLQTGRAKYAR